MPPAGPSPLLAFETLNAYQRCAALKAAIDLKLFTAVAGGADTAASLARACGVAERGARILADYLTTLGFMTKAGGKYALTPDSAMFLDAKSPAYLGGAVEFLNSDHLMGTFARLTDSVRAGGARPDAGALAPDHESWVRFARGMAGVMGQPADALARQTLGNSADQPIKVLDVAAGHGLFGLAFARQNPRATVVASDWGNVLEVARENAVKMGVADRWRGVPGSAFDVDWGGGYDVVLLTNFLHHFDRDANIALLKRVHAALKPGGRAVALEFVPNDDRVTPPASATFALVMLATTPAGDAYTAGDYRPMFQTAGFSDITCANLEGTMQQVVAAVR